MNIIANLIEQFDPEKPNFRPTEIYNENWMLKAFLHQASKADLTDSPLSFFDGAGWFSEALLPSAFQARYRDDPLAETRTNADGVIGHFRIGEKTKADFELNSDPRQFVVVEAKIGSPLSSGTKNAPEFDQGARNVACIAEVLYRADKLPADLEQLAFIVLAPEYSIKAGSFSAEMEIQGMRRKIHNRVSKYDGMLDEWCENWVEPTLALITISSVSWEQAIKDLRRDNPEAADSLQEFYELCLKFK